MTSSHKKLQKELKQPDQFQTWFMQVSDWTVKNKASLVKMVVPVLVLFFGVFIALWIKELMDESRRASLAEIDVIYSAEEASANSKRKEIRERMDKIEAEAVKTAQADTKDEGASPDTKEETETEKKIKALDEELKAVKADHSGSHEKYRAFFAENSDSPEGWTAGVRAVNLDLEAGDIGKAEGILKQVLSSRRGSDFFDVQVRSIYISVLEEQGKYDEAIKEVDAILELKSTDKALAPRFLLTKGRIQLLKDSKDAAFETLKGLVDGHGLSLEAARARTMMALWK